MTFAIKQCKELKDVHIIDRYVYHDFRGVYHETYNKNIFSDSNLNINFIQDTTSISKKNVLRGYHGDNKTWKLISCLSGSLILSVLCYDKKSSDYLKVSSYKLSGEIGVSILVPPNYGNAHFVISDSAVFHYKQSTLYSGADKQFTIRWDDPKIANIFGDIDPIISDRDKSAKLL